MGLGQLFNRNLTYQVTDTQSGAAETFTIVTDGLGAYPEWSTGEYRGGMALPGAWRAAVLLSDLIGSVPWHALRERAGQPVETLSPTPPLLDQPAPPDVRMATFSSLALDLLWHGNAIALVAARNWEGWPTALLPVPADSVHVKRVQSADNVALPVGSIAYQINGRWYSAEDVLHVKGPARPGALRGMGVLENHFNGALSLATELARQAGNVGSSGIPTGKLKITDPEATEDDLKKAKAGWTKAQRDRSVAVLNATTDFEPLAWNPSETQLLDARKFSLHEIALIFGLPLSFLGADQSSRTYSNIEQESLNLIKYSLGGHLARFEQTLTAHLPRGTWAKANLDSILRADTLTRYQAHALAVQNRFLTPSEVRDLEDRPPLTAGQLAEFPTPAAPRPVSGTGDDEDDQTPEPDDPEARAADHDGSNLKHYWTKGAGLAKWASKPHPWTALYRHLRKYMSEERAKRTASQWFKDVFGIWPGERFGDNPVGMG